MGGFFLLKSRADVFGLPQTTMAYLIMLALQRMQNSGRRRQKRRKSKKKRKKRKNKQKRKERAIVTFHRRRALGHWDLTDASSPRHCSFLFMADSQANHHHVRIKTLHWFVFPTQASRNVLPARANL